MAPNDPKSIVVLLVEDNADHAHVIGRHLSKPAEWQIRLEQVDRLAAAIERIDGGGVDVLLLDLSLPDSPINETLPRMIEAHGELPIIVLTSLDDLEFGTRAVGQGAQDFLVKTDLNGPLLLRSISHAMERKKTQDRLESYAAELASSNERLRGFAHTVAHEVKSPLTAVSACLQLLDQKFRDRFEQGDREAVIDALAALNGLTQMVNELLEFSRLNSAPSSLEDVDTEGVFYQAYVCLRPAIRESGAQVTHDSLPTVRGNEWQLRQLLVNLIGNAIKYSGPREPEIHVGVDESDAGWTFRVQDNGLGIAEDDRERVFEAFVRLHKPDEIQGTGIGLAFCKRIVEVHGGRLWVESQPGAGSTFKFTLPK